MELVSAAEFQKRIGYYQDRALAEPIMVTRNGRDRLVLLSVETLLSILVLPALILAHLAALVLITHGPSPVLLVSASKREEVTPSALTRSICYAL